MVLVLLISLMMGSISSRVHRSEIENAVERHIRERLKNSAMEVVVEFRSVPDGLVVRGIDHSIRVTGGSTLWGNVSLPVEILTDGRVDQQCLVSVKVRTFDSAFVATRQLKQYSKITLDEVQKQKVETSSIQGVPVKDVSGFDNVRTSRIVSAGAVLTRNLVEPIPVVTRGSAVTLVVRGKHMQFSVAAVVREDGLKGEIVTVQRAGSGARLEATVVDERTVEMTIH